MCLNRKYYNNYIVEFGIAQINVIKNIRMKLSIEGRKFINNAFISLLVKLLNPRYNFKVSLLLKIKFSELIRAFSKNALLNEYVTALNANITKEQNTSSRIDSQKLYIEKNIAIV